ncbi:MAG: YicC/YloC family endoribonuclease [bacterium]
MIKSMTGFASSVVDHAGLNITLEIKSLNHRFLDIVTRLPRGFNSLDIQIRNYIKTFVSRGRIELSISIENANDNFQLLKVDYNMAKQYYQCLYSLKENLKIEEKVGLQDILKYGDIIKFKEVFSEEETWPVVKSIIDMALEKLLDMRTQEGVLLHQDIDKRLVSISGYLLIISQRIPLSLKEYQSNLRERLKELFQIEIPDERLEQEMIIYAEKSDVTEEIVRIESHISQMRELLNAEGPVGRKMDFLVQELYRETNTLGSKTTDIVITDNVVAIKSELEKIKEQIQNIE